MGVIELLAVLAAHLFWVIIMALTAMGMWVAMGDDMILAFWGRWVNRLPKALSYPLGKCPRCMVTLFGTAGALALGWQFDLVHWLVYIPAAVGLQELLQR